ncbi:MAG: 2-C-methyl-D-erythritol 4-phosphate cytidylyltransferase [Desulfobacter sp.]
MSSVMGIILASGTGSRFNDGEPKQFVKLAGLPVIVHTLKIFESCQSISGVVVVTQQEHVDQIWEYVSLFGLKKVDKVVVGGATRQESSRIGIECCSPETGFVLIHDAVRPFVTNMILETMIAAVMEHRAVDTVIPSADTIVEVDPDGFIATIPDRSRLRRGQTPQAFDRQLICDAHLSAMQDGVHNATDDCALVLRLGHKVFTVPGDEQNIKITYPLDLHIADKLFQLKMRGKGERAALSSLEGKVCIVFGGTSGIGSMLVNDLQHHGAKVFHFSRSTRLSVDVTSLGSIQDAIGRVVADAGRIDFVLSCSGDLIRKNVENMSEQEWRHIYDTNVTGAFLVAKAAIPVLKEQGTGSIYFIGSSSYTRGREGYAAYSSSKAALVNFCQAIAEELSPWNIRVNVVSPGRVNTPLRHRNFGNEPPGSLLEPDYVAREFVKFLTVETTGSVFEIA